MKKPTKCLTLFEIRKWQVEDTVILFHGTRNESIFLNQTFSWNATFSICLEKLNNWSAWECSTKNLIWPLWLQTKGRNGTSQHTLLVSWGYGSEKIFESMIRDIIDRLRNITSAVNQNFVQKGQLETSSRHRVVFQKIDLSIMYSQVTPFCYPIFKKFHR